jgi:peptide/nickel transport system substrate-binding protein
MRDAKEARSVLSQFLFAEPLLSLDWTGRPSPGLAAQWQWQDEGRILEIQLRPGAKFHDGAPVDAGSVVQILRQRVKADRDGFRYVTAIQAPDSRRVVFRLSRADPFLLDAIAGTLIVDEGKPTIGTGPFEVLSDTPSIRAVKNKDYYLGSPAIDSVEVIAYSTPRAAWAAMMRGEVDMVQDVNADSAEFLKGASQFQMYSSIRPYYIPFVFNLRHPILKRVEVRRALVEAIDRDEIVRQAMGGHGRVADDPVWPFQWAYNAAGRKYTHNSNAARLRLDAAGLQMHRAPDGESMDSRFRIRCLFWGADAQSERIALLLQRQLADVGVDLVVESAEQDDLTERVARGDFDTYLFLMGSGRSFNWTYRFWHSPTPGMRTYQDSGYTGADNLLEQLRLAQKDADVRVAVADLRQRFYEDAPAAFLAWPEATRAVNTRFDLGDGAKTDFFANLWRWRPAPMVRASR